MTASSANSKFTNGDKAAAAGNKNTTAESRRASKPLMEKRRRARINQSLAVLKSLIVDSQRVEGQKHAKLEKADILEMTTKYLQSVKKSDEQKFLEGFEECLSETTRFLQKSKANDGLLDKLTDHLTRFKQNLDLPTSFSEVVPSSQQAQLLVHQPVSNGLDGGISTSSSTSSAILLKKEDSVKLLSHLQQPLTTTTTTTSTTFESSSVDPTCAISTTITSNNAASTFGLNVPRLKREPSLSPLHSSNKGKMKGAPSSTHSSSTCLSPSFSNDSNNNNFVLSQEMDGFRRGRLSPPSSPVTNMIVMEQHLGGYPHPGSVESFDKIPPPLNQQIITTRITQSPISCDPHLRLTRTTATLSQNNNNANAYVLNLSTQSSNNGNSSLFANYCNNGTSSTTARQDEAMEEEDYCSEPLDFSKPLNLSKHETVMYRLAEDDQGRTWRPW